MIPAARICRSLYRDGKSAESLQCSLIYFSDAYPTGAYVSAAMSAVIDNTTRKRYGSLLLADSLLP